MPIVITPGTTPPAPPVVVTGLDGVLTATLGSPGGGVLLVANFSALVPQPYKVLFLRDGLPVRSGDTAFAPGGVAIAYDYEMPLGVASIWTATAMYRSTTTGLLVAGVTSSPAALTTVDVDTSFDFFVKSIPDPASSLRLRSQFPDPTYSRTGRNALTDVPASPYAAGSYDVQIVAPRQISFKTETHVERDALLRLLDSGPVLVQSLRLYGTADYYALLLDVEEKYHVGAYAPARIITVTFAVVARPATIGAPLYVPGHSYADVDAAYVDYDQLTSAVPNYLTLVGAA